MLRTTGGMYCRYVQGTTAQEFTTLTCFSRQLSAAGYARHSLTKMTISLAVYLSYLDKTVPQASKWVLPQKGSSAFA